jgi:RHS repeat-associated protein
VGPISYNAYQWNSPVKITMPGGSTKEYAYDPLVRVKTILAKDPGQNPIMTRQYQYSPAGNITSKETEHGAYTYQYDALSRLTQADNPTLADEAYTYDALGNRITEAGISGEWTYNANNELLSYGTKAFTYDDNGNMTQKAEASQEVNYIYDVEDRLVRVDDGSASAIAEYYNDPFGRRLWKQVDGVRTYFVYSDEGLVGEYDGTGTELRTYGWAPGSQWGTDPLFVKIGSQYYWYQNDHQGTPQKITTSSGLVVWSATYDSFGNAEIGIEGITNNLRFPGQYYDSETGLHYNLNRYYDSATGRYLRTDPLRNGINLYAYVLNNPSALIDPRGLCAAGRLWNAFWYDWFFDISDFVAGFGDTISLDATKWIRSMWNEAFWGGEDVVNYHSGFYKTGIAAGYAWELGFAAVGSAKILGQRALVVAAKAGGTGGSIVGAITFSAELAAGKSFKDAAKSAAISGITSGVSIGLGLTKTPFLVAGSVATAVNAVLQRAFNGDINPLGAVFSGFGTSISGVMLSQAEIGSAVVAGIVYGQVVAPTSLVADVLSQRFSKQARKD